VPTTNTNVINITNLDFNFDGYISSNGSVINLIDNLWIGGAVITDAAPSLGPFNTNIVQLGANRDHTLRRNSVGAMALEDNSGDLWVGNGSVAGKNIDRRAYLTFSLDAIPISANITAATLKLRVQQWFGTPVTPLHLDHIIYSNEFGTTDMDARFDMSPPRTVQDLNFAQISSGATGAVIEIPVKDQVSWSLANPAGWTETDGSDRIFQLRIRDNDGVNGGGNAVNFYRQESGAGFEPVLAVTYIIPGTSTYTNKTVRSFTSFDLSQIAVPTTGNITAATLFLYHSDLQGDSSEIGTIWIDQVDYNTNQLVASVFTNASVIGLPIDTFSPISGAGWLNFEVGAEVEDALTNAKSWARGGSSNWFQIMLRPSALGVDTIPDKQLMNGAEGIGIKPYIRVWYVSNSPLVTPPSVVINIADVDGNNIVTKSDTNIIIISSNLPNILLTKSVESVSLNSVSSPSVPGSTLTYRIVFTNASSNNGASGFKLQDSVPTNARYVTGSMRAGTNTDTYASAAGKSDAVDADSAHLIANTAILTLATLGAEEAGTFFYQV